MLTRFTLYVIFVIEDVVLWWLAFLAEKRFLMLFVTFFYFPPHTPHKPHTGPSSSRYRLTASQ